MDLESLLGLVAAKRYDSLRQEHSPEDIQSTVGMAREGYINPATVSGMTKAQLAQLDRASQGEIYGKSYQLADPKKDPFTAPGLNTLGFLMSLPGAVIGGGANELSKAIPGGQEVAGKVAGMLGGDPTQFEVGDRTSPASVANLAALLRGTWRGAQGIQ